MVDGTGLRPTTDGSAGSDKIANDYMFETYHKQVTSVPHPAREPEPPKPEPPKPSKPTQKSPSTPSYIKQYNPDHNEFEPAYTIEKTEGTSSGENIKDVASGKAGTQDFIDDVVFDISLDSLKKSIENTVNNFKGVLTSDVVDIAKNNTDELFGFGGLFIDFASQIIDGKGVGYALAMTGFHLAVEWAFALAVATILPANIAVVASIILASAVNIVIDNYLDPYFRR